MPKHASVQPTLPMPLHFSLLILVGLAALVAATYAPVRNNDFVSFDDPSYVTENPHVRAGITAHGLLWALTTGDAANWHPLTWFSHMLDVQFFGINAGPHHVTSVLFHIANTCLLFGLLLSMTGAPGRSALTAALFAVHPMHVESVAWIAERKDVLSTFFGLLTLYAYVAYVRRGGATRFLSSLVLFALGLMAKPMLVTLPFLMVLLDWWPLRRFNAKTMPRKLVQEKIPFFVLAAISSGITIMVQHTGGAVRTLEAVPLQARLSNALVSYIAYITKLIWPVRLAIFYPLPKSIPAWEAIGSALIIAVITVVVFKFGSRYPYLPTGWFWYLGTLVPVIGLIQVGEQAMADRYSYIPSIGLFILASWGIADLLSRRNSAIKFVALLAILLIVVFAITSRNQLSYWKNNFTVWNHALAVSEDNYFALVHVGNVVLAGGNEIFPKADPDKALTYFSRALEIRPDFDLALDNMGIVLLNQGKHPEALPYLTKAVQVSPNFSHAHNDLGVAMERFGRFDDAISEYEQAVRLDSNLQVAHVNLAKLLATRGRLDDAIREYSEAIRLKPDDPVPHYDLGIVFNSKGDVRRAIAEFSIVLKLKPDSAEAQRALSLLSRSVRSE
jgi:tetratricopeptide (TPR) repeat protein